MVWCYVSDHINTKKGAEKAKALREKGAEKAKALREAFRNAEDP